MNKAVIHGELPAQKQDLLGQVQRTQSVKGIDLRLPDQSSWQLRQGEALMTAEWCRDIIALVGFKSVQVAVERWRGDIGGNRYLQAILAMVSADGMLHEDRIDQAVSLIDLSHSILGQVRAEDYAGEPAERQVALLMVDDLARRIHAQAELERYGPAWVAYRDADVLRREGTDPFGAIVGFQAVEAAYPGTILALASRANRLVLQMQTSASLYADARASWLERMAARTAALKKRLDGMTADGFTDPERVEEQRAVAEQQGQMLAALRAWPQDPRSAGKRAWREAEVFIAEKPEGLYRCDAMLAQAEWIWNEQGDPQRARVIYDALLAWLARVPVRDRDLDAYPIDERIRVVSAPPPAATSQDDFGNQRWTTVAPGALINHRTCPWYIDSLIMRAAAGAGLCAFATGDLAGAAAYVDRLAAADPFEALRLAKRLQVSNATRLRDGFATGRLFGTAPELAQFMGAERTWLLTAEVAYECEEWSRARTAYKAVQESLGQRAKPGQACYLQFMLAMCAMNLYPSQLRKPTEILTSCSRAFPSTPTWPRVQLALWNLLQWDESTRATGLDHLAKLVASTVPQSYRDEALFHRAQHFLVVRKDWPGARAMFNQLTSSSVPWVRQGARNWLDDTIRLKQGFP